MYMKFVSVLVGTMLFSSAQAASTTSSTKKEVDPGESPRSYLDVQAGEHQVTLQPSALLLLSVGLFGIVAVARREPT